MYFLLHLTPKFNIHGDFIGLMSNGEKVGIFYFVIVLSPVLSTIGPHFYQDAHGIAFKGQSRCNPTIFHCLSTYRSVDNRNTAN